MSDRMTGVRLRNEQGGGYAEYGRKSRAEMISTYRELAKFELAKWQKVVNATDEEFIVETYIGAFAEKCKTEVTK